MGEGSATPAGNLPERRRGTSLGPHDLFLLDQWGRQLNEAFGETPYLVGSVIRAERDWRDVDVRMLLPDGASWAAEIRARLRVLNLSVTLWGRSVTGLPVDFQFQPADLFHAEKGRRSALGITSRIDAQEARDAAA